MKATDILVSTRAGSLARHQGGSIDLDRIIADHARDFAATSPDRWGRDRVVFLGPRIVAVLRRLDDGGVAVHRFG